MTLMRCGGNSSTTQITVMYSIKSVRFFKSKWKLSVDDKYWTICNFWYLVILLQEAILKKNTWLLIEILRYKFPKIYKQKWQTLGKKVPLMLKASLCYCWMLNMICQFTIEEEIVSIIGVRSKKHKYHLKIRFLLHCTSLHFYHVMTQLATCS